MSDTRGPWVITKVNEPRRRAPQHYTWKELAALLTNNVGHVALALYELARKPTQSKEVSDG